MLYQEFSVSSFGVCMQYIFLHLFGDGCLLTFSGVYLITSNREVLAGEDEVHSNDGPRDKRSHISISDVYCASSDANTPQSTASHDCMEVCACPHHVGQPRGALQAVLGARLVPVPSHVSCVGVSTALRDTTFVCGLSITAFCEHDF